MIEKFKFTELLLKGVYVIDDFFLSGIREGFTKSVVSFGCLDTRLAA